MDVPRRIYNLGYNDPQVEQKFNQREDLRFKFMKMNGRQF